MATIVTRSGKGSPLTNTEVDSNFTNLNTDKLELSGGTMSGDLSFGDNDKAIFGAGSDLQIFHTGTNSQIIDAGNGDLYIGADSQLGFLNAALTEWKIKADTDGAVKLYYDNSQKLATTSYGIDITGRLVTTSHIDAPDNARIRLGDADDLQIYHDGADSYIDDAGAGALAIRSNSINLQKYTGETMAVFTADGAVELRYDNATKLTTTSTGIDVTGTVTADGLTVETSASDTGVDLVLDGNKTSNGGIGSIIFNNSGDSVGMIRSNRASANDAADLLFYTQETGGANTKRLNIASNGDISFYEDTGTTAKFFWDASAESLGIGQGVFSGTQALNLKGEGIAIKNDKSGSSNNWSLIRNTGTSSTSNVSFVTGTGEAMVLAHNMNVGIGTSSPAQKLTVASEGRLRLNRADNTRYADMYVNNNFLNIETSNDPIKLSSISYTRFDVSGTERMRINSSGNLLFNGNGVVSVQSASNNMYIGGGTYTPAELNLQAGTSFMRMYTNGSERMRIDSSGRVGIGTTNPIAQFAVGGAGKRIEIQGTDCVIRGYNRTASWANINFEAAGYVFDCNGSERMRIDSSGNLLLGKSAMSGSTAGLQVKPAGELSVVRDANHSLILNRKTSDGNIALFQKDGTTVGSIGADFGYLTIGDGSCRLLFLDSTPSIIPRGATNTGSNGAIDLGDSGSRFKDLYLSGGIKIVSPNTTSAAAIVFGDSADAATGSIGYWNSDDSLRFSGYNNAESMRIDSSGNVLIGKTALDGLGSRGLELRGDGLLLASRTSQPMSLDRTGSDGVISGFYKDGAIVGAISTKSDDLVIHSSTTNHVGLSFGDGNVLPTNNYGTTSTNTVDLGSTSRRFKDFYLDGSIVNPSGDLTVDVSGNIVLDADGGGVYFKDAGTNIGFLQNSGANDFRIVAGQQDKDIVFMGNNNGSTITALTLDMSSAGEATFNDDINLGDSKRLRMGAGGDFEIFHDGANNYIKGASSDQDIIFQGVDNGSTVTALTLDMSEAGAATFNGKVTTAARKTFASRYQNSNSFGSNFSWDRLQLGNNGTNKIIAGNTSAGGSLLFVVNNSVDLVDATTASGTNGVDAMKIDSSGNVLVGTTDTTPYNNSANSTADNGIALGSSGILSVAKNNDSPIIANRTGSDGGVVKLHKNGVDRGGIGLYNGDPYISRASGSGMRWYTGAVVPTNDAGNDSNNTMDLGSNSVRFKHGYFSGSLYGDGSNLTGVGGSTTLGAVGTYTVAANSTTNSATIASGATVAGSTLRTNYYSSTHRRPLMGEWSTSQDSSFSQSGTWRNMTGATTGSQFNVYATSLWVRIS